MIVDGNMFFYDIVLASYLFLIFKLMLTLERINKEKKRKSKKIKYYSTAPDIYPDLNKNFAYNYAACFDILAAQDMKIEPRSIGTIDTGLVFCLPFELELQVRPKSGRSKDGVHIELGTIDGDYRGNIFATIYNFTDDEINIKRGEKICQGRIDELTFMPFKGDKFIKVNSLDEFDPELKTTLRGSSGFGSSGK